MIRKVYYLDNVVAFCTAHRNPAVTDNSGETAWLVLRIDTWTEEEVKNTLEITNLRQIFETAKSIAFVAKDAEQVDRLFALFASQFRRIDASGGVVRSSQGEVLMIYRNGRWDLPKGKVEDGETLEVTAVREMEEECGITGLRLKELITDTYHIYPLGEEWVLKRTAWYGMKYKGDQELIPQVEEGITDLRWVPVDESMEAYLQNTYQTIRDVLEEAL